ncbi:MAG: AraC family transcriptional regulator [Caulobacterales bacterium]|nr:AraC family transcriptional regulator [Caulobacterales bacterium]
MSHEPMVSTQIVLPVVDRLREEGVRARPLLKRLGIDPACLDDVDERVSLRQYVQFFEDAAEACGNPYFGLDAGRLRDSGSLGAIGFLFLSAPTLQDAFMGLRDYLQALQEASECNLYIEEDGARSIYRIIDDSIAPRRQDTEYSVSATFSLVVSYVGAAFTPREVTFEHERVGSHSRYESHFGCDVFFGQPLNSIVFDKEFLAVSAPRISRTLYPIIASHLRDVMSTRAAPTSLAAQVSALLTGPVLAGGPTIGRIAEKLGMSESTLARRLRAEGASFNAVLADKRMSVAQRLLTHSDTPIGEIALSLGYAENASFTRAFKAWCDMTPEQFRANGRA